MRSFSLALVLALAAALLIELGGVWWAMPLAGAVAGYLLQKGGAGFLAGGLGVALAWAVYLVVFALTSPLGALLTIFAGILDLGASLAFVPVVLALVVAFVLGGLGGLIGAFGSQARRPEVAWPRTARKGTT